MQDDKTWDAIEPWMRAIRREIHRYPELGLETPRTQAVVETALDELGIAHSRPIAHGVKAVVGAERTGPALLLRADMDALPIVEQSDLPFKSEIAGRMHACGHDCHTAMLLGAARYLMTHHESLYGPIVLMFQPGEEGPGGARPMIEAGVLSDPPIRRAAMVHISSDLPCGVIGLRSGPTMGACDDFTLTVYGTGGHGSAPHNGVDAIWVSSNIIQAMQSLVSREQNPFDPLIISIGTIHGGYRENVIADQVVMTGTVRSMSPKTRGHVLSRLREVVEGMANTHRARVDLVIETGYPPLVADPEWANDARTIVADEVGSERVREIEPTLGVEDFAYVAERVPSICLNVGIVGERFTTGLHSAGLMVDERALRYGARALAALALNPS